MSNTNKRQRLYAANDEETENNLNIINNDNNTTMQPTILSDNTRRFLNKRISEGNAPVNQTLRSCITINNYIRLQHDFDRALRIAEITLIPYEFENRMAELEKRRLTNDHITQIIQDRRRELEENLYDGILLRSSSTFDPTDRATVKVAFNKVNDSLSQFYKMLHRKRMSVIEGRRLPPENSIFSQIVYNKN